MPVVMMELLERAKRGVEVVATTAGSIAKEEVQNAVADSGAPTTAGPASTTPNAKGIDKLKSLVTDELNKCKPSMVLSK